MFSLDPQALQLWSNILRVLKVAAASLSNLYIGSVLSLLPKNFLGLAKLIRGKDATTVSLFLIIRSFPYFRKAPLAVFSLCFNESVSTQEYFMM